MEVAADMYPRIREAELAIQQADEGGATWAGVLGRDLVAVMHVQPPLGRQGDGPGEGVVDGRLQADRPVVSGPEPAILPWRRQGIARNFLGQIGVHIPVVG